jgi:hypothetical protein
MYAVACNRLSVRVRVIDPPIDAEVTRIRCVTSDDHVAAGGRWLGP